MKKIVVCLLGWSLSAAVLAATYTMGPGSRPSCSSGGWTISGSTYTCSGSISLASGDKILPAGNITVVAEAGITLAGSNTIGSSGATANLQTTYGTLASNGSGTVIYGNLTATSGAINLTNTTLNGSITTNGTVSFTGGSVSGNVFGKNGVTTNGTTIGGTVTASSGAVSLTGGSVDGLVSSNCCGVTTSNTNLGGGVSSSNNTINISGGTISGPISSSGGSGIVISGATMTSGSITTTSVPISISNSTIGTSTSPVDVTGNNTVTISGSSIYGDVTAGSWSSALSIDSSSTVYGTCQSDNNSVSTPSQYPRCAITALAEWRMDESAWSGIANEVKDSSGNGYHGFAAYASGSGPRPTTTSGSSAYTNGTLSTCRYGQFDSPSTPVRSYTYVQLASFPSLPGSFTFAGWVRTTDRTQPGQRILVNDDAQDGWGFSLGDGGTGTLRFFNRNIDNTGSVSGGADGSCGVFCMDTPNVVANNTWYFVAVTVNTSTKTIILYVFNNAGTRLAMTTGRYSGTWASGSGVTAIGGETAASGEGTNINYHFRGNIDEVKVYSSDLSEAALKSELTKVRACTTLDHVELVHDGAALTCTAEAVSVLGCTSSASCYQVAASQSADSFLVTPNTIAGAQWCTDSACASPISGAVTLSSGSTIYLRKTTVGSVTMGGTASPATNATVQCRNTATNGFGSGSPACDVSFASSGLILNTVNHVSCSPQGITIKAVSANNTATACVPTFANVNRDLTMYMGYVNPTSGTQKASFDYITSAGGASSTVAALSTSSGAPTTLSNLYWDGSGTATLNNFRYPDVGQVQLNPSATTSGGLTLNAVGGNQFITAPASFSFTSTPSGNIRAGDPFTVEVSAMNACATPAVTPNFGKETTPENATLSFDSRVAPTGTNNCTNGPCDGTYTGTISSWTSGVGKSLDSKWSEVGQIKLKATLASASYLSSGVAAASGTSGPIGNFVPAYFDTVVTPGCGTTFTYSGQPFTVTATAKNAQDGTTVNYSNLGGCSVCSRDVTLSDVAAASTGAFSNNTILASAFAKGVGSTSTVAYTFNIKTTAPRRAVSPATSLVVRAKDSTTSLASPLPTGLTEGSTEVRSGRLRLFNAFGSEKQDLAMPVQAEYWGGNAWVLNSDDSCTTLVAGNIFKTSASAVCNTAVTASAVTISAGRGVLTLSKPGAGNACSVDVAANLGASGNDQSCLSTHGGTAGGRQWLRAQNGNCAATYDRDPSARATFGIYSPETRRVVHTRELF